MSTTAVHRLARSFIVVAAATALSGCTDGAALGPDPETESSAQQVVAGAMGSAVTAASGMPDLGVCQNLEVPAGNKLFKRVYAAGVQIYTWNGTSWSFQGPLADLSADAAGRSTIGIHYGGPTWESNSGSKVVGAVVDRCTPDPASIPWLLLAAVSTEGPGIFHRVTFIQRVNTAAGNAPAQPGTAIGEEARVPYTTEYLFYRAK